MGFDGGLEAEGRDGLEAVTFRDVLDDPADSVFELLIGDVGLDRMGFALEIGEGREWAGEAGFDSLDFGGGSFIALRGAVGDDNNADKVLRVVEDNYGVANHEGDIVDIEVVGVAVGEGFDGSDVVIGDEADGATAEFGEVGGELGWGEVEKGAEFGERVVAGVESFVGGLALVGDGDLTVFGPEEAARTDADETVAGDLLAAGDAFEEEAIGFVVGKFPVSPEWCLEVGEGFVVDRDGVGALGG